ncbi:phage tail protein [Carnimonas bestiolae]|uniref:phage tail protein n=1 Tax=Carnimonas bestiolae TaxID=3402172 RepID=UPI003EDBDA3B
MKKLTALRRHLINALPPFNTDPDAFLAFIEDGSIEFWRGKTLTHDWQYTAQFVFTAFALDTDVLMTALLQWLAVYEPELDSKDGIKVEAEIIDESTIDLIVRVKLTEKVVVEVDRDTGTLHARHTMPRFEEERYCGPWELYLNEGDHLTFLHKWTAEEMSSYGR